MRKILFVAAALLIVGVAGTGPSAAGQNAWCAKTPVNGGNPECNFSTFRQCRATVSGIGGDCIRNPGLAYNRMRGDAGWIDDGYDSHSAYANGFDHPAWHGWTTGWDDRRW